MEVYSWENHGKTIGNPIGTWDLASGKLLQKTNWKDPPFLARKTHDFHDHFQ